MEAKTYSTQEVAELTGLAYHTVISYARRFPGLVPVERHGNRLLFPPGAIDALKQLHEAKMSGRLKRAGADAMREDLLGSLKSARQTNTSLSKMLERAISRLEEYRPATSVWIHTLPEGPYRLKRPVSFLLERVASTYVATLVEADLTASGETWRQAVHRLRLLILRTLTHLKEDPPPGSLALGQLHVLRELTVPKEEDQRDSPGGPATAPTAGEVDPTPP